MTTLWVATTNGGSVTTAPYIRTGSANSAAPSAVYFAGAGPVIESPPEKPKTKRFDPSRLRASALTQLTAELPRDWGRRKR